jgi:hypothetical protein
LIKVSTWDKNEISITGSVAINEGENDDAFALTSSSTGLVFQIRGEMGKPKERVSEVSEKVLCGLKRKTKGQSPRSTHDRGKQLWIVVYEAYFDFHG